MKILLFLSSLLSIGVAGCKGQAAFGLDELKLQKEIPLPGVKGRIDHMDANAKDGVVYMSALGNNTLEVIDLKTGKRIHSIEGLSEPQGVGYIPETAEIIVANGGNGDCYFYNARSFEKLATVHLAGDADDVRYDPAEKKLYVGYGTGGIAIIDATTHAQTGNIKLPVHPEGFQIDKGLHQLFVNLPDAHTIGVADLQSSRLTRQWNTDGLSANFPMSLDAASNRLFIGYRHPAKLVVMNGTSGAVLSSSDMTGDVDDLYYDAARKRVYISGGGGAVDVFSEERNGFKQVAHIPTRSGARTSLFIPALNVFVLAERAEGGREARLAVYSTQ